MRLTDEQKARVDSDPVLIDKLMGWANKKAGMRREDDRQLVRDFVAGRIMYAAQTFLEGKGGTWRTYASFVVRRALPNVFKRLKYEKKLRHHVSYEFADIQDHQPRVRKKPSERLWHRDKAPVDLSRLRKHLGHLTPVESKILFARLDGAAQSAFPEVGAYDKIRRIELRALAKIGAIP